VSIFGRVAGETGFLYKSLVSYRQFLKETRFLCGGWKAVSRFCQAQGKINRNSDRVWSAIRPRSCRLGWGNETQQPAFLEWERWVSLRLTQPTIY